MRELIGIPWVYKASDCWAIFRMASKLIGRDIHDLNLPDKSSPRENSRIFEEELSSPRWKKVDSIREGCAIIFYGSAHKPIHIGFAVDSKHVLHSMGSSKTVNHSSCDKIDRLIKKGLYKSYEIYDYCL